jgi:hypothetical protein
MTLGERKLSTLYRLAHLLAGGTDGASLLRAILRETLTLTGGRGGQILLPNGDGRTVHTMIAEGEGEREGVSADQSLWAMPCGKGGRWASRPPSARMHTNRAPRR